ncbi:MAG: nucleotidyltransferase domain-containing protein, partial [bacterium]
TIIQRAREFGVKRIWLFGSMLGPNLEIEPQDIDLAVEGVPPEKFFRFWGRLDSAVRSNIDLVYMDNKPPIRHIVMKQGVIIYGE